MARSWVWILTVVIMLLALEQTWGAQANANQQPLSVPAPVWSANFETEDNSQFNGRVVNTCVNGIVGVSTTIVHSGTYSGYYYGQSSSSLLACKETPTLGLSGSYSVYQPIVNFHFMVWVYVQTAALHGWISLATFNTNTQGGPFTIDVNRDGYIDL